MLTKSISAMMPCRAACYADVRNPLHLKSDELTCCISKQVIEKRYFTRDPSQVSCAFISVCFKKVVVPLKCKYCFALQKCPSHVFKYKRMLCVSADDRLHRPKALQLQEFALWLNALCGLIFTNVDFPQTSLATAVKCIFTFVYSLYMYSLTM